MQKTISPPLKMIDLSCREVTPGQTIQGVSLIRNYDNNSIHPAKTMSIIKTLSDKLQGSGELENIVVHGEVEFRVTEFMPFILEWNQNQLRFKRCDSNSR